jgi:hypothetical protein
MQFYKFINSALDGGETADARRIEKLLVAYRILL